jgi:hypothetical protein
MTHMRAFKKQNIVYEYSGKINRQTKVTWYKLMDRYQRRRKHKLRINNKWLKESPFTKQKSWS